MHSLLLSKTLSSPRGPGDTDESFNVAAFDYRPLSIKVSGVDDQRGQQYTSEAADNNGSHVSRHEGKHVGLYQ